MADSAHEDAVATIEAIFKNAKQRHADYKVMQKDEFLKKYSASDYRHEHGGFFIRAGRWVCSKITKQST